MNKSEQPMLPLDILREGRDEMNLAEYPFAVLWSKSEATAEIYHEWETRHPTNGKKLKAFWRVTGDPKLGLPLASDEQVYLVLMELTLEAGLEQQSVHFTRHNVLHRLGWPDNENGYRMLEQALTRLVSVTITSQNAFWNAQAKSFETVGFNLLDNFKIIPERPGRRKSGNTELPMSFFKWNDAIFQSMKAGYIRTLNVGVALSLKSSIALRLYRYLGKKSYDGRREFEIELSALCERHLGMRPNPYPSKYKERLKPAHDELMARGFLDNVQYVAMKSKKAEKVRYTFARPTNRAAKTSAAENLQPTLPELMAPPFAEAKIAEPKTTETTALEAKVAAPHEADETPDALQRMIEIKVSPDVAQELLQAVPLETLETQLDCLNDREPKDAAATFVKAVRENWEPPKKYFERLEAFKRSQISRTTKDTIRRQKAAQGALAREKEASADREAASLDELWLKLDAETQKRIEDEAQNHLGVLGRTGRAQSALVAMRRTLMRELLGLTEGDREEQI